MKKFLLVMLMLSVGLFAVEMPLLNKYAVDPVYQLPLKNFKRFICEAKLDNGQVVQFVSVKSMMLVYFHQKHFKETGFLSSNIKTMYVQEYLTGKRLKAQNAVYVFGSNLVQPKGEDLVPCRNMKYAKIFENKYGGTKIVTFKEINKNLLDYLDLGY